MWYYTKLIFGFIFKLILALIIVAALLYGLLYYYLKPSNDRVWAKDMNTLASATVNGDLVTIKNIRDITYRDTLGYDLNYYDETFDLNKLESVYFFTNPFGSLSAHTMMGFEFSDGKKVVLSVEVRREIGEWFNGYKGVLRQYELIYVWAAETDVVKLRTNIRNDAVYMYKMDMSQENSVKLFWEAIKRTNQLYQTPEFYDTLFNNCTTNLINQLQIVYGRKIVWDWRYFAPAFAEQLAIKNDLITTGETIDEVRKTANISLYARQCGDCADYSGAIRKIFTD